MDYLKGLNDRQKEAVLHTEGPLLILAGAGSGKTKVVTDKIAYLIKEKNIFPGNILAITFTNKAAGEMKDRIYSKLDRDLDYMWVGTFHSICLRILRYNIEKIGYTSSFSIYDRDDQVTLMRECLEELNVDKDIYKENQVLSYIGKLKDSMVKPEDFIKDNYKDFYRRNVGELFSLYQKKLKEYNALDFDDLIIKTVELLEGHQDVLDYYQEKFKYVFVDEYQDTNKTQYRLTRLLSGKYNNISVVGDPDQSVYSWRGADINNILDFERDFKGGKTILLEENYRSSKKILDLANELIKNNSKRKEKNLWTSKEEGEDVFYHELADEREEARFVADTIDELLRDGYKLKDMALLYRTNAQSRIFEEQFMSRSIPYKIVGGLKFYDRKEIKDIIAYLKLVQNPRDNVSFKRIVNVPKRGVGGVSLSRLEEDAFNNGYSLFDSLVNLENLNIRGKARDSLEDFLKTINGLIDKKDKIGLKDFIESLIDETGYLEELKKENTIESQTRIENIQEFLSVALDYEMLNQEPSLEDFLGSLALLSDLDKTEDGENVITLMTLHSSKGLEFPVVFLVGMEDGLFPSYRSLDNEDDMEEERRLCYVGVTRAEEVLYLTAAKYRTIYGKTNYTLASRFIKEMGPYIKHMTKTESFVKKDLRQGRQIEKSIPSGYFNKQEPGVNLFKSNKAAKKKDQVEFKLGDKINHNKWGIGTVVQVKDRESGDQELTIAFEKEGLKKVIGSIAPIKLVR